MQQRGAGPDASPIVSQLAMHLMAILAVASVGLGLAFMSLGGLGTAADRPGAADGSAPPADGVAEKATPIESLPFRDDAVEPPPAGTAAGEPRSSCLTPSHTAWYTLVPESDLPLSVWVVPDTDGAAALDVGVAVFAQQADGSLLESGCVDDRGAGGPEQIVLTAHQGQAYDIGVSAVDRPEPGEGSLTFLAQRQRPEYDLFTFARRVSETPFEDVDVDAVGARTEPGEITPSCADVDATTWYAIWSPQDAILSATVSPAGEAEDALDAAIALHTGDAVDALTEVACSDASGVDGTEHLEVPIFGGEDYWLQVGAVLSQDAGPGVYTLSIDGIQTIDLRPLPDTVLGADPAAISAEASSGLPVAFEVAGPCRVADGQLVADGAGLCTVTASQPGDADWAPAAPVSTTLRVARGRQAIDLRPVAGVSVGEPIVISAEADSGLPVRIEAAGACRLDDGVPLAVRAGICTITARQPGDSDWEPAPSLTTTVAVERGRQAIELAPLEPTTVDVRVIELSATSDSGLPVTLDVEGPCEVDGRSLRVLGSGRCTITAVQAGDVDWAPAEPVSTIVRIGRGQQAITLAPLPSELSFGDAPVALSATSGSGLPVTLELEGPCELDAEGLVTTGAGDCTITAVQAGDVDWAPAEPVSASIAIAPASQTITLEPIDRLSVGQSGEVVAVADSGLPVALDASGPCLIDGRSLRVLGSGRCTITAVQAGDVDWAPAEPVSTIVRIGRGQQAITLAPIESQLLGDEPIEPQAVATSGLAISFSASGACRVDEGAVVLLRGGRCTITAVQAGDDDWAPAEASASFRVVAPITEEREDFSDDAMTSPPGALVGDGARISSHFPATGAAQHHYAVALDEGQILHITATGEGTVWAIAGPSELATAEGTWTEVVVEPDSEIAEWVAAESGIHSIRVEDTGVASAYTMGIDVDPVGRTADAKRELEGALLDRMQPVSCRVLREDEEVSAFAFGALAGVRCRRLAQGIFEVKLLTFPDVERLRAFHQARVDKVKPALRETPRACAQGSAGVRDWEFGRIACWTPPGRSRGVLHWTDERTNTYGILRTFVDDNRVRLRLWGKLVRRIA